MKKADIILFGILIGFGVLSSIFLQKSPQKGKLVNIIVKGKELVVPLEKDTIIRVEGRIGKTCVRIEKRSVWIEETLCPKKICKKMGKIKAPGEVIVCIPNEVIIRIKGKEVLDGITY